MSALTADEAKTLSERLRLFAQPQRLLILSTLLEGELAVSDIETRTGVTQPTLSQQIGTLRRAGVLAARRDSRSMYYSFASEDELKRARLLMGVLDMPVPEGPPLSRASSAPVVQAQPSPRTTVGGGACFAQVKVTGRSSGGSR